MLCDVCDWRRFIEAFEQFNFHNQYVRGKYVPPTYVLTLQPIRYCNFY